jgi:hypothetical protein
MAEPFQLDTLTAVSPHQGRVILFHTATQPDVQFHRIRVDEQNRDRLVAGGYLSYDLPAGPHTISASRRMTAGARRHECHTRKGEAQICTDTRVRPQFRHVDAAHALANLEDLAEIRQ